MSVADRLLEIRGRIEAAAKSASRAPSDVRLVAVSKRQPMARVREAYDAGQRLFGENFVQALCDRKAELPDAEWHLIGHLQSNKAKLAARDAHVIHSIDSVKVARALHAAAVRPIRALVQVNIDREASKSGFEPDQVEPALEEIAKLESLRIEGLMCIPSPDAGTRSAFERLKKLKDALASATGLPLPELSMGMSDDYEDAIAEGATLVRVGSALFGPRPGA